MHFLFSFLQPDCPHSTLLAGYFSKVYDIANFSLKAMYLIPILCISLENCMVVEKLSCNTVKLLNCIYKVFASLIVDAMAIYVLFSFL